MKKIVLAFLSVLIISAVSAQDKLIAEWDFTRGLPQGKYAGSLRPNAKIDGGLVNIKIKDGKAGGYVLPRIFAELTPPEGFRLEIRFMTGAGGTWRYNRLFDNQWATTEPNTEPTNRFFDRGICCKLLWSNHIYTPFVTVGLGRGKTVKLHGTPFKHVPEKINQLTFIYDGQGKAHLKINDLPLRTKPMPQGEKLALAWKELIIGDRLGPFEPFDGKILSVRIFSLNQKTDVQK